MSSSFGAANNMVKLCGSGDGKINGLELRENHLLELHYVAQVLHLLFLNAICFSLLSAISFPLLFHSFEFGKELLFLFSREKMHGQVTESGAPNSHLMPKLLSISLSRDHAFHQEPASDIIVFVFLSKLS